VGALRLYLAIVVAMAHLQTTFFAANGIPFPVIIWDLTPATP